MYEKIDIDIQTLQTLYTRIIKKSDNPGKNILELLLEIRSVLDDTNSDLTTLKKGNLSEARIEAFQYSIYYLISRVLFKVVDTFYE